MTTDLTNQATLIGLDIGGTKTAIVEGTCDAQIIRREEVLTWAQRPFNETFPQLADLIESTVADSQRAGRRPGAISVSVGGPLQITAGVLDNPPHLPGWHGVRLKDELENRFPGLPVRVEHDGNAGALAEYHFGVGRQLLGLKHLVFLTLGTGLGAGIILNGHLLRGASDLAGEVGHIRLAPDGPVGFGKAGSWEGFCSGAGMLQLAKQMFPSQWGANAAMADLVEATLQGNEEALAVVYEAGMWLGRGMALLIDILNPEVIVLGSLAIVLGERLSEPARQTLRAEALPKALAACRIIPATLGKSIGDVASLMAVLNDAQLREKFREQSIVCLDQKGSGER
jgi:glucokinase